MCVISSRCGQNRKKGYNKLFCCRDRDGTRGFVEEEGMVKFMVSLPWPAQAVYSQGMAADIRGWDTCMS